jgi:hypothetical protein
MADTIASKAIAFGRVGSTPTFGTGTPSGGYCLIFDLSVLPVYQMDSIRNCSTPCFHL